jgi:ribonuclease E
MSREMLINVAEGQECRIAVVGNGALEELYIERTSSDSKVGNIYKGRVVNIESGIQAAFVDFGAGRNGFLHISDLHPRYFPGSQKAEQSETIGHRKALRERLPIQKCLHKGSEIIVQVTKEGINSKGPTLSTYLALPGKYLVMMPWMHKEGVSHKIEDEQERERLRKILEQNRLPKDIGFIIRTAAEGASKRDIQRDLRYLNRLWYSIDRRIRNDNAPAELYRESDLVIRTLRDVFTTNITQIVCDSEAVVRKIRDFLSQAYPRLRHRLTFYNEQMPLFHQYKIEDEIAKVQSRTVELKCGGSIIIEQTEALVAIDVNSGRYRRQENAEQTAFSINSEAASEIARQLRLRDLGGLIICDFIDMRNEKHRRDIEKIFRDALKADRARIKILRISRFGIIEMTRQRMRPSLQSTICLVCPQCGGSGFVKSQESQTIEMLRLLRLSASKEQIKRIELFVSPEVAEYLQNEKRSAISRIEQQSDKKIVIHSAVNFTGEKYEILCYNDRGAVVKL